MVDANITESSGKLHARRGMVLHVVVVAMYVQSILWYLGRTATHVGGKYRSDVC